MIRPAATAAAGYAALVLVAVVAPAWVIEHAGDRGGLREPDDAHLIGVSLAVGVPAAVLAWRRLRPGRRTGRSRIDDWVAALASFGVLAGAASALPTVALHATTSLPSGNADPGWRVSLVWGASQAAAVALGEGSHRLALRWLSR